MKIIIKKEDYTKGPNKMHVDALQRFPARVVEDKRKKKEKHKKKYFEEF